MTKFYAALSSRRLLRSGDCLYWVADLNSIDKPDTHTSPQGESVNMCERGCAMFWNFRFVPSNKWCDNDSLILLMFRQSISGKFHHISKNSDFVHNFHSATKLNLHLNLLLFFQLILFEPFLPSCCQPHTHHTYILSLPHSPSALDTHAFGLSSTLVIPLTADTEEGWLQRLSGQRILFRPAVAVCIRSMMRHESQSWVSRRICAVIRYVRNTHTHFIQQPLHITNPTQRHTPCVRTRIHTSRTGGHKHFPAHRGEEHLPRASRPQKSVFRV